MNLKALCGRPLQVVMLLAITAPSAHSTCWECLYDPGLEAWYCHSIAGEGAADCEPSWDEPCELIGTASCQSDGCHCYRYPAIKEPGDAARPRPLVSTFVMLLQGSRPAAQSALARALSGGRSVLSVDNDAMKVDPILKAVADHADRLTREDLRIAAFGAASGRGVAVLRLLSPDRVGLLVDARRGAVEPHVRVSRLSSDFAVASTLDMDLAPTSVSVSSVSLDDEEYACVVWARQVEMDRQATAASQRGHNAFIDAINMHPALSIKEFYVDSPRLETLYALGNWAGAPAPWAMAKPFYK